MSEPRDHEAARAAARDRHPSVRLAIDLDLMRRREAQRLAAAGHPCPAEAAAAIATRGRMGLGRSGLATLLGVPVAQLTRLEEGREP